MTTIHLGFEVGTGEPVAIPLKHMAVTGQTQESGKTTTLEALVSRLKPGTVALTFITKRGESAFQDGQQTLPYFRDRADWQFVDTLLAAQLQEKNKFLRPWIIKICRNTLNLADVQREVRWALKKAHGFNEGIYTQLDAYLDLIVPEIQRAKLAPELLLRPGLNVMDVSGFATPMMMLFVQSALDVVNAEAENTVVVIPEAWEFIPEGKGSPVKASAEALVRKGAGLGNHIWVDSQDMAGVHKVILRGCTVWIIGVQREANEIKRTLANIPAGIKKPSAQDVALLERGQFYACWGKHAIKVYVQPAWMDAETAKDIATGDAVLGEVVRPSRLQPIPGFAFPPASVIATIEERQVKESEARELRDMNERLESANRTLLGRVQELERLIEDRAKGVVPPPIGSKPELVSAITASAPNGTYEAVYAYVRDRLAKEDPKLLKLAVTKPEIEVTVNRPTIEASDETLFGRVAALVAEGFFDEGANGNTAFNELVRRGRGSAKPNVYKECDKLAALGFLTKEPTGGYKIIVGAKVRIKESR